MNILFYVGYYSFDWSPTDINDKGFGGSETCAVQLAEELVKNNQCVVTIAGAVTSQNHNNVNYINFDSFFNLDTFYDVIVGINYIHYMKELEDYCIWGDSFFWLHNFEPFIGWRGESEFVGWENTFNDSRLTSVVCVSEYQATKVKQLYSIPDEKVVVRSNAIDHSMFPPVVVKHPSIIWSSAPDRGFDKILKLWPKIKELVPEITLELCYPEYASDYLKDVDLTKYKGIIDHGVLSKPDLYKLMSTSFLWFYPTSYEETFCITAIEMMRSRVKVVTTEIGNLTVLLDGGRNGTIVSPHWDDDTLLRTLVETIDHSIQTPCVDNAYEFANTFTWSKMATEWNDMMRRSTTLDVHNEATPPPLLPITRVDKIYIISLNDSPSMRKHWRVELDKANIHVEFEVFKGINGNEIDFMYFEDHRYTLYPNWKIEKSDNSWWNRDMTPGEIGCALSHYAIWKKIVHAGENNVLILEEDFKFGMKLTSEMLNTIPAHIDMIYLGRTPIDTNILECELTYDWTMPSASYNLHAYMLSQHGANKLIAHNFQDNIMPVDDWIISTYTHHSRPDLHNTVMNMHVIAATPEVFTQTSTLHNSQTENIHKPEFNLSLANDYPVLDMSNYDEWKRKYLRPGVNTMEWDLIVSEDIDGVFETLFFTDLFCKEMIKVAEQTNIWTTARHEFYPTTDVVLQQLQSEDMYNRILTDFIYPLCIHLYDLDGQGWDNMQSENFLAKYTPNNQSHLGIHHDSSDISALVNLSDTDNYTGGGTWFKRQRKLSRPQQGTLSIHPGNITHKHGAKPITEGLRYIMVSFMKNSSRH